MWCCSCYPCHCSLLPIMVFSFQNYTTDRKLVSDILWGAVPATPANNYSDYRNMWLRVAKNIGQAGRPVVLCGTAIPEQFETCPERRYFSTLHYLAMVCD